SARRGDANHKRISVLGASTFSQQRPTSFNHYESAWRTVNTGSNPVGATMAGGTGIADQQSSVGSRPEKLIAPRRPFVEGRKRQPLVEERLQHPARFGLATDQDAVEVGRATRECGAKALAVGEFKTG